MHPSEQMVYVLRHSTQARTWDSYAIGVLVAVVCWHDEIAKDKERWMGMAFVKALIALA